MLIQAAYLRADLENYITQLTSNKLDRTGFSSFGNEKKNAAIFINYDLRLSVRISVHLSFNFGL